jgi:hypothetical protein
MAITVASSPNDNQPAYNQVLFDISSSNTSQPNFNFVVDVYVKQTSDVLAARLLYPKQPSSTSVKIDISNILKTYVTHTFDFTSSFYPDSNGQLDYFVQFGEAYDVSGTLTIYPNLTRNPSSNYKRVYNSIFDFEDFSANVLNSYRMDNFGFLTTIPEAIKVEQGDKILLSYYDPSGITKKIKTEKGTSFTDTFTLTSGKFKYNIIPSTYMYASYPATNLYQTGDYKISILDNSNNSLGFINIEVSEPCGKYETYRLHWFNKLGGWDSYNFTKVSVQNESIEKSMYKKALNMPYNTSDRLMTIYNTRIVDEVTINSDWVSDEMAVWFENLFTSPLVFLERQTPTSLTPDMVAINITNSSYEKRKYSNGRQLHNITLSFNYTYDRYTQSQ